MLCVVYNEHCARPWRHFLMWLGWFTLFTYVFSSDDDIRMWYSIWELRVWLKIISPLWLGVGAHSWLLYVCSE